MRTLLLAAVLLASRVFAEGYTSPEVFNFSLTRAEQTSGADADLHVSLSGVSAKYGVKRASRDGDFQSREVAVIDEAYLIRDAKGGTWRMWMRPAIGPETTLMQVELVRAESSALAFTGNFRPSSLSINGTEMPPSVAMLELSADGSFRLGTLKGHYLRDERGGIALDGAPAGWGRGTFSLNGNTLVFKYMRHNVEYLAHYNVATVAIAQAY